MMCALLIWLVAGNLAALDNEYVLVTRDAAPCAQAEVPGCADRVIVALGDIQVRSGETVRSLARGDVAVFSAGDSYEPPTGGPFLEVAIKPDHPPAESPGETILPEKNALRHDGDGFFVFEERLAPGDTRPRHSHSRRVIVQLNRTVLQQWVDGAPEKHVETVPDRVSFGLPVIHTVKNVGDTPLRGIVIEFKPGR
jgi:quercetin dioxygenase-like cupin family protein